MKEQKLAERSIGFGIKESTWSNSPSRKDESMMQGSTRITLNSSRGPFYKDQVMFKTRINFMNIQHNPSIQSKISQFFEKPPPVLAHDDAH
jgi:hypothetical protein